MEYDIILITGETFFDHPLCGIAILKRLLEKKGYSVEIIEKPGKEEEIKKFGQPRLFFGVSSGSIDSLLRNYTPLKKPRKNDPYSHYDEQMPDRAVIIYCNWIKRYYKNTVLVIGGTEASLRRFVHYDYWDNKLRKPILMDSRADILVYGNGEKQILEIAQQLKEKKELQRIKGTCIISQNLPPEFTELPSYPEVLNSKERFCDFQNLLTNTKNLAQKIDNRYILQYQSPLYTSQDLDEYYELPFTRKIPLKHLRGFEFSVVTHRGCIGECNFCAVRLIQGNKIISRSPESILKEIEKITKLPYFKGNIDDLGGPSANMYGLDCHLCEKSCIDCPRLDRTNQKLIQLLRKARSIQKINKVYIKSGIRYDLASSQYIKEIAQHHLFDTLRIAPEHVNPKVLELMNKNRGNLKRFLAEFKETNKELSFYFMTAHPGSTMKEAEELAKFIKTLKNTESVQIFIPTPMTVSTCMYYTSLNPKTKEKVYVPYTYSEKKKQKRVIFGKNLVKKPEKRGKDL